MKEIQAGTLNSQYNMGTLTSGYTRTVPYSVGTVLSPASFTIYNETTGSTNTIASSSSKYSELLKKDGVPYASYYHSSGWGNAGMSVMIPPGYAESKVVHDYDIHGLKGTAIGHCSNKYKLWAEDEVDIHYRVIHEHGEVVSN